MDTVKIKRAIISVSDKTGVADFAKYLDSKGIELFSTGGTYKLLKENNISVKEVNELTGFPEMMDGRVKTLNPKVHGGILALRDNEEHIKQAKDNDIKFIDMLVVNLYPFENTIKKEDCTLEDAIENIDIGGPTMLRSSAKNYKFVTIITDPTDYQRFQEEYEKNGGTSLEFREECALKVFAQTSRYDAMISEYLSLKLKGVDKKSVRLESGKELRYGENPHQKGKLYLEDGNVSGLLATAEQISGKEMSYINYLDAQAALDLVIEFNEPAAVVVKHATPCGVATGNDAREAIEKAWFSDPISAMGSVLAFNREFDKKALKFIKGKETKHYSFQVDNDKLIPHEIKVGGKFVEVIVAPSFSPDALEYLTKKKNSKNIRLLKIDIEKSRACKDFSLKRIDGGYLWQSRDNELFSKLECVTEKKFDDKMIELAKFSMLACKHIKSNTITLGRIMPDGSFTLLGMGAGQPNRVDSLRKLAVTKARENLEYEFNSKNMEGDFEEYFQKVMNTEVVMASDAFFPFDDTVRTAGLYGVKYIVQPGGSMNDEDSIKACNELGIAMVMSGNRHFIH